MSVSADACVVCGASFVSTRPGLICGNTCMQIARDMTVTHMPCSTPGCTDRSFHCAADGHAWPCSIAESGGYGSEGDR